MEGPISFWGYKEQESNLILPEHDDDDDDDDDDEIWTKIGLFVATYSDIDRFSLKLVAPSILVLRACKMDRLSASILIGTHQKHTFLSQKNMTINSMNILNSYSFSWNVKTSDIRFAATGLLAAVAGKLVEMFRPIGLRPFLASLWVTGQVKCRWQIHHIAASAGLSELMRDAWKCKSRPQMQTNYTVKW